jgi:hypothetical protein
VVSELPKIMPEEPIVEWLPIMEEMRERAVAFVTRWPNFRQEAAMSLFIEAVTMCDLMGVNAEAWLEELRKMQPSPSPMTPPRSS